MNSNELNRATKYLKCVKTNCKPKKTKRFRKCSEDVECGNNIAALQECIDGVKLESMKKVVGNTVHNEYNNPLNIMRKGIYKTQKKNRGIYHVGEKQNNGTYTSIKPSSGAGSYVEMHGVKIPGPSANYVKMNPNPKRRAPAILPKPKKTSKKSSPHIYARVRKTRTNTKNSPIFYGPTQRDGKKQGKRQGSPLKPTIPKKPKLGKVAELRKKFEQNTKK